MATAPPAGTVATPSVQVAALTWFQNEISNVLLTFHPDWIPWYLLLRPLGSAKVQSAEICVLILEGLMCFSKHGGGTSSERHKIKKSFVFKRHWRIFKLLGEIFLEENKVMIINTLKVQ